VADERRILLLLAVGRNVYRRVPLAREDLDEVLSSYRRPNDKVSEWLLERALQPLRRGLNLTGAPLRAKSVCQQLA
jgi:hypothetical protein